LRVPIREIKAPIRDMHFPELGYMRIANTNTHTHTHTHTHTLVQVQLYSLSIVTPIGNLAKSNLLRWGDCIGIARFFIMVGIDCHVRFFAVVLQYMPVAGIAETWEEKGSEVCVCTSDICSNVSFVKEGPYLRPHSRDMHG